MRTGDYFRSDQQEWSTTSNGSDNQLLTVVGSFDELFFYLNRSGQVLLCMNYSAEQLLPVSMYSILQTANDLYLHHNLVRNLLLFKVFDCFSVQLLLVKSSRIMIN
jgi:hypothetical protein